MHPEKKNVISLYNLPSKVKFCKTCTISNQRPRISFDENGICSACNFATYKRNEIDWELREKELVSLCDKYRKKNGDYDVIVPCSGGKDGGYVAHQLKYKYKMNPLTVTWAPLKATDIGRKNLNAFINAGYNHILGTPNPIVTRKLTKLSFEILGDPFQPFIYGQSNFPLQVSVNFNIPLIMYGENGEVEYGGDMKNAFSPTRDVTDHNKHYFSNYPPEFWSKYNITQNDLKPFTSPDINQIKKRNVQIHFFGYYKFWDPQECFYYSSKYNGFSPNSERNEGTYSKYASLDDKLDGFHYYLSYIKFGIGRATSDSAHEIRDSKIDRDEGIQLVKKFDHEFPKKYFDEFLEYVDLTEEKTNEIIDSWRSPHLWKKINNKWELISPIWKQNN